MRGLESLFRYLRLFAALGRFSLLTEMAFRANYLLKITVEILWIVLLLLFYSTIFAKTTSVADWTENEYLFFLGCYYALDGLMETLFLTNFSEFAELVRKGDLDLILIQPIDEQFLVSCKTIEWSIRAEHFHGHRSDDLRPDQDGLAGQHHAGGRIRGDVPVRWRCRIASF